MVPQSGDESLEDVKCKDTGVEVSVLCTQVYDQLKVKPPIKRHVKMIQAGNKARLRGFVAGPFDVRVGRRSHRMDLYVAHSRTPCFWGWTLCVTARQSWTWKMEP